MVKVSDPKQTNNDIPTMTPVMGTPVYYAALPPEVDDDEINLIDYWRVLVRYKWLIISLSALCTLSAFIVALWSPPIYRAETTLSPVSDDKGSQLSALAGQFGGLASLAGVNLSGAGSGRVEDALATLKSRHFSHAFIAEFDIATVFEQSAPDHLAQDWPILANLRNQLVSLSASTDKTEPMTAWDIFEQFDKMRIVTQDRKTGLLIVAIEWGEPTQAANWANALVARLNRHQKQAAISEAERSIAYLKKQLEQTGVVEMRQSIFRLIEAQTKNIMLANVREEFAFKVIDPALPPQRSVKPKRKMMVIIGFIVGLGSSVLLAFLLSFIKNQRQQADDKIQETKSSSV